MNYYVPNSIKLISGSFSYGETVIVEVDGKQMKRKVNYGTLCGLYITIKGEKYGITDFDKE